MHEGPPRGVPITNYDLKKKSAKIKVGAQAPDGILLFIYRPEQ